MPSWQKEIWWRVWYTWLSCSVSSYFTLWLFQVFMMWLHENIRKKESKSQPYVNTLLTVNTGNWKQHAKSCAAQICKYIVRTVLTTVITIYLYIFQYITIYSKAVLTLVFHRPWERMKEEMGKGRNGDTKKSIRDWPGSLGMDPLSIKGS